MVVSLVKSFTILILLIGWLFSPRVRNTIFKGLDLAEKVAEKHRRLVLFAVLTTYCIVSVMLHLMHEEGGDEAQAWLLVRDTTSLRDFYRYVPYEGTPVLWHMILYPFAKSGFPFETIYVINFLIAACAVTIFLFYAPVPLLLKIVIPFTYMFIWEYGVFARNYALPCMLLFAGLAVYSRQPGKWGWWGLLFFLCANSNFPATILSGSIIVYLLFNKDSSYKKERIYGALFVLAGIIVSLVQVLPTPTDVSIRDYMVFRPYLSKFTHVITTGYQPLSGIIYLLVCTALIIAFRNRVLILTFLAGQIALFLFFALIFTGRPRHHLILFLGILLVLWLAQAKNRSWVFVFFIAVFMVGPGIKFSSKELATHTTYAKELAALIRSEQVKQKTFVAVFTDYTGLPVAAYLPGSKFYFPKGERWGTFCIWDSTRTSKKFTPANFHQVHAIKNQFPGYEKYLFLSVTKLNTDSVNKYGIRLITERHETINRGFSRAIDDYYLYDLGKP
jgi:hypothetical protein